MGMQDNIDLNKSYDSWHFPAVSLRCSIFKAK